MKLYKWSYPKFMKYCFSLIALLLIMTGCTEKTEVYPDDPEAILRSYFESLYDENYDRVVTYYGGTYELLQGYHPQMNGNHHAELFRAYIEITGGQLVKIDSIINVKEILANEEYQYELTFIDKEGNSFREGMVYTYGVKKVDGKFKVMDLPPYLA